MASLHYYLMVRYAVNDYAGYLHLLAMFRNTNAIEAGNARADYAELVDLATSNELARLAVLKRIRDRRSN